MRVGITFFSFDLLLSDYEVILKEAKNKCDYLIVGLQLDPSFNIINKITPVQSIIDRYIQLKGFNFVDEIVPYVLERDVEDILRSFKIDVCIIGKEYKTIDFTGKEYCIQKGIEIYFNELDCHFFST